MERGNLFASIPSQLPQEQIDLLAQSGSIRIERILSRGQVTDGWYDQAQEEWVALLAGEARLQFEGHSDITLRAGDWLLIRAHQRHRVTWTSTEPACIWLTVHFRAQDGTTCPR